MTEEPKKKNRKFRGTIVVEHNQWNAKFFKGKQAKEPFGTVGNVEVAYKFVKMLEELGFDVDIHDFSEED